MAKHSESVWGSPLPSVKINLSDRGRGETLKFYTGKHGDKPSKQKNNIGTECVSEFHDVYLKTLVGV